MFSNFPWQRWGFLLTGGFQISYPLVPADGLLPEGNQGRLCARPGSRRPRKLHLRSHEFPGRTLD